MLLDGQAMKNEFPGSFFLPSEEQIAGIVPGTYVKVSSYGERFWVCVVKVEGDTIDGVIDNTLLRPINRSMLERGHCIRLQAHHILDVQSPKMKEVFVNALACMPRAGSGRGVVSPMPVDHATNRPRTVEELFVTYMTRRNLGL